MFMIILVLDDPNQLDAVLQAWEEMGVRGAAIMESTGINRRWNRVIPMRYLFQTSKTIEEGHLTLFAIVATQALVDASLAAVESVTGDLDQPPTGIFAAFPLTMAKGIASAGDNT